MRKILAPAMAALTLAGAIGATATPAAAQHYRGSYHGGYHGGYYRGGGHGDAVAAGVVGLAVGAALASSSNHNYYGRGGYYAPGYYGRPYGYATCESRQWVYDPYMGREVLVHRAYAC